MELVSIEQSRLVSLFGATRPNGQLYMPEVVDALADRYSFVDRPKSVVGIDTLEFKVGKYGDTGIETLAVYTDGTIISARSNTDILEQFFADAMNWLRERFGVVRVETVRISKTYESHLVVQSEKDLLKVIRAAAKIGDLISRPLAQATGIESKYSPVSLVFGPDPGKLPGDELKPNLFRIERRAGIPFERNRFFSTAPLPTNEHIKVLSAIEELI